MLKMQVIHPSQYHCEKMISLPLISAWIANPYMVWKTFYNYWQYEQFEVSLLQMQNKTLIMERYQEGAANQGDFQIKK